MSDRSTPFRRRVSEIRDRMNAQFSRLLNENVDEGRTSLLQRFEAFRQEEGGRPLRRQRRGTGRPRQVMFKVSVLRSPTVTHYRSHRDATPACRVVVPFNLSHQQFVQALKDNVQEMPAQFQLCKMNGQRVFVPIVEETPRDIKSRNALGRSNLYIRPKITEDSVRPASVQVEHPEMESLQQASETPASEAAASATPDQRRDIWGSEFMRVLPNSTPLTDDLSSSGDVQDPELNREEFYVDSELSDVDEAMLASPDQNDQNDELDLATLVTQLQTDHIDSSNTSVVIVRRRYILQSACVALSKSYFAWNKVPNIEFVGEMADDYGGPRREFFRLVVIEVQNSLGVFEGKPGNLFFNYSQQLLASNKFYTAGKLTAWSVAHNGPGPRCINKHLFLMMCGQKTSLEDVELGLFTDEEFRKNLEEVEKCSTPHGLAELKGHLGDWIAGCGIPDVYTATLQDLPRIKSEIVAHFVFHRVASMIQQFIAGMDSCGRFWQMVKRFWKQFLPVFTNTGQKLTRNCFQNLFTTTWSPAGSNRREDEEATIFQWEWWLLAIQEQEVEHTFEELLVFITGADSLPPLGFPQSCSINFYDQEVGKRRIPYASTCSLCLFLPRGVADEELFKELMHTALKGSLGFGKA